VTARGKMKCTLKSKEEETGKKNKKVPQISVMIESPQHNREVTMGRVKLTIDNTCRYTHFTWEQRLQLQYHYTGAGKYKKITSPTVLGKLFGKHESTLRRELKRGMVEHEKTDLSTVMEYNAEYAQSDAQQKGSAKGPELKLGYDWPLVEAVRHLIKDKEYAPFAVIAEFNNKGWPSATRICEKTLYNYIQAGYLGDVTEQDLLYQGKRRKSKGEPNRHSRASAAAKSISNRPHAADDRSEFGHWEADTVVGAKGSSSTCLMTLTERKTRFEITRRIGSRSAEALKNELDVLERQIGATLFKQLFRSVTADNGGEFSDIEGIEYSALSSKQRLTLYFAHPYSSFERGTNENQNGIIRRFIPKGSDIGEYTKKTVRSVQDWMNSYPRKILRGMTPRMALQAELGSELCLPGILEVRR
jgi:transposase, IS30 family